MEFASFCCYICLQSVVAILLFSSALENVLVSLLINYTILFSLSICKDKNNCEK